MSCSSLSYPSTCLLLKRGDRTERYDQWDSSIVLSVSSNFLAKSGPKNRQLNMKFSILHLYTRCKLFFILFFIVLNYFIVNNLHIQLTTTHFHLVPRRRTVELYTNSPTRLHGVVVN